MEDVAADADKKVCGRPDHSIGVQATMYARYGHKITRKKFEIQTGGMYWGEWMPLQQATWP